MRKSGVKFGLIGSASSLKSGTAKARPIGSKPPPRRRPPGATAVFNADSDEEEGSKDDPSGVAAVNKRLAAISAKQEKQAKKEYEDALEADPSVFDYDRIYDGMKESRESKVVASTVAHEKEKRQPKYIGNLLKQAKMRAVDSDRIFERKLQKEREEQDKLEGEATMKFVTSAYKKKLMEQKKWELQEQLEEEREQRDDVTKTGMSGFYSNLITKNIAMGGDVEKSANSAFTAGSKRHAATDDYDMQDGNAKGASTAANADTADNSEEDCGSGGKSMEGDGETADDDAAPTARMVDPRAAAARTREGVDGEGGLVRDTPSLGEGDDRSGVIGQRGSGARDSGMVRKREEDGGVDEATDGAKRARQEGAGVGEGAEELEEGDGQREELEVSEEEKREAEELEKAHRAAAAKAKKEAAVKAARERFLARKKAST